MDRPGGAVSRMEKKNIPMCGTEGNILRWLNPTAALACVLMFARVASADDWPFFRGPHYNGISAETGWISEWPKSGPRVAWRASNLVG